MPLCLLLTPLLDESSLQVIKLMPACRPAHKRHHVCSGSGGAHIHTQLPLSLLCVQAAQVLQQRYPTVTAVFSSDLLRAVQTAEVVAAAYQMQVCVNLSVAFDCMQMQDSSA